MIEGTKMLNSQLIHRHKGSLVFQKNRVLPPGARDKSIRGSLFSTALCWRARLFDCLGMKCLYSAEWADYFRQLQTNPDSKLEGLYISTQMNSRTTACWPICQKTISGLKEPYRQAWLEESTPTACPAPDALRRRVALLAGRPAGPDGQGLHGRSKSEPFPPITVIRPGRSASE